jgi:cob(I)alamin adenosyltransferase
MRITKVTTKVGDGGDTYLGGGQKVPKDSPRIEAFGTVDELNSVIGVALAAGVDAGLAASLRRIQNELFHLGSDLCVLEEDKEKFKIPRIEKRHVDQLERDMDVLLEHLTPLEEFILPGGAPGAAHLHVARTVCRRAGASRRRARSERAHWRFRGDLLEPALGLPLRRSTRGEPSEAAGGRLLGQGALKPRARRGWVADHPDPTCGVQILDGRRAYRSAGRSTSR